jgi:hypothetical protein
MAVPPAAGGGAANGGGGTADMKAMMDQMNQQATERSLLNMQDQGEKEKIQAVNTAAKAGHDENAEINRNLK